MVNADPTGLGNSFEDTATHLMLAGPIEKKVKNHRKPGGASISSTLAGRGNTGIDLCWYNRDEFKQLNKEQRDELIEWQRLDADKVVIKANTNKLKA